MPADENGEASGNQKLVLDRRLRRSIENGTRRYSEAGQAYDETPNSRAVHR